MKRVVTLVLLCCLAALAVRGQDIPSVGLVDASGRKVATSSLIDHKTPFVISMWMTSCKPCLKELEAVMDEAADWDGDFPLRVYAVSVDDSRSLQRAVVMSKAWEGVTPLFDPNGDLRRALNVSAVPQVFVYDKDGNLYHTHIGYRPGDELQLLATLRKCAGK